MWGPVIKYFGRVEPLGTAAHSLPACCLYAMSACRRGRLGLTDLGPKASEARYFCPTTKLNLTSSPFSNTLLAMGLWGLAYIVPLLWVDEPTRLAGLFRNLFPRQRSPSTLVSSSPSYTGVGYQARLAYIVLDTFAPASRGASDRVASASLFASPFASLQIDG